MMLKDNIIIRDMTLDDIKEVSSIEKECFSLPWSEKAFIDELSIDGSIILVSVLNNKIVGFINGRLIIDEFYINNIAVTPNSRRCHIGEGLILMLHKRISDNVVFSTLEVRESNLSAISLYKKCGYENVGLRKNFYEKPTENAILMTKFFKSK